MKFAQAKQVAIQTAASFKQPMFVVERNGNFFAADKGDMRRQFAGLTPVLTIAKPGIDEDSTWRCCACGQVTERKGRRYECFCDRAAKEAA